MQYRRDIDGLRAVAVLPVILFHAGFTLFGGGYVGVDIFFVISGYLISSILLAELQQDKFSLRRFYERRVRRILPALYLVMVACLPFAWAWLLSSDLKSFAKSVAAVSLYLSNLLFARESGYFDGASELKPLLHTWSLAVEEQFYLIFPALLWLLWRLGKSRLVWWLAALAALSFIHASVTTASSPTNAFYLLPSRGWELLVGALIALLHAGHLGPWQPERQPRWLSELLSGAGLLLILFAIFSFDKTTRFPGVAALVPTVGAALIIGFNQASNWTSRLLSSKAFVGVGLISYSAYLWHQPLFAFARVRSIDEPTPLLMLGLAAAALLLAYFSWRYVEQPFRDRKRFSARQIWQLALLSSVLLIAASIAGYAVAKRDHRQLTNGDRYADLDQRLRANFGLSSRCDKQFTVATECRTAAPPELVVWGDSFAMHLVDGVRAADPALGLVQMTKSACAPILGLAPVGAGEYNARWAAECLQFNEQVLAWIKQTPSIKYVLLSSPLARYVTSEHQLLTADGVVAMNAELVQQQLQQTMQTLTALGIKPIWFSPPPQIGRDIGQCLVKSRLFGQASAQCDLPRADVEQYQQPVLALLRALDQQHEVVWLHAFMCDETRCRSTLDDRFLYRDSGHLSREGVALLGQKMQFVQRFRAP